MPGGPLEILATTDDNGTARSAAVEISPLDRSITLRGDRFPLRAFAHVLGAPAGLDLTDTRASGTLVVGVVLVSSEGASQVTVGSAPSTVKAPRNWASAPSTVLPAWSVAWL